MIPENHMKIETINDAKVALMQMRSGKDKVFNLHVTRNELFKSRVMKYIWKQEIIEKFEYVVYVYIESFLYIPCTDYNRSIKIMKVCEGIFFTHEDIDWEKQYIEYEYETQTYSVKEKIERVVVTEAETTRKTKRRKWVSHRRRLLNRAQRKDIL